MRLFADTANMEELKKMDAMGLLEAVSYTHLTLPTT